MLKYIDRDKLRGMTGFGRDKAVALDDAFGRMLKKHGPDANGNLVLMFSSATPWEFRELFVSTEKTEGGIPTFNAEIQIHTQVGGATSTERFIVPLSSVVQSYQPSGHYQLYTHTFNKDSLGNDIAGASYTGITKRGWRTRWHEHVTAARRGSRYRFHQAIAEHLNNARHVTHHCVFYGISEKVALLMEQLMVEAGTLYPKGLNMIPGGTAGLAYLHKIGALNRGERVTPDDKHEIINRFFDRASREGIPNPLAAANWLNPEYAEKIICGPEGRLKPDQIRQARFLSSLGRSFEEIVADVRPKNSNQIQRLLAGKTYARVA